MIRVELYRDGMYGSYNAYKWLEENVGPGLGNGWRICSERIVVSKSEIKYNRYIEISNELDAVAYKLKFKL